MTSIWKMVLIGQVQGVGLRFAIQRQAQALKLSGFVKNDKNGSVCIVAAGSIASLEQLELWLSGSPGSSNVKKIQVLEKFSGKPFEKFEIVY